MHFGIRDTHPEMLIAASLAACRAEQDLVPCEHRIRFVVAVRAIGLAHQSAATVGAAQVLRAVDQAIDRAAGLVLFADMVGAARTLRDLVHANDFT
jgi:hypothetical protein